MNRENYKNFIMKTLLANGGSMERSDVIIKFKEKFLAGDGSIYVRADELVGSEYEDFWYNAIGWARSELRVDGLLQSRNPVGLWELTPAGIKNAQQLPQEEGLLYGEHAWRGIAKDISGAINTEPG